MAWRRQRGALRTTQTQSCFLPDKSFNGFKHAQTLNIKILFDVARLGAGRERGREARHAPPRLRVAFSLIRVQTLKISTLFNVARLGAG